MASVAVGGFKQVNRNHNERDYNHTVDPECQRLRNLAESASKKRIELIKSSKAAYANGSKGEAHELSEQAKQQLELANKYNACLLYTSRCV